MRIKPLNFIVEAIVCNFISKQIILINGPIRRRYNSWKALSSETTRPGRILALGCQLPRWYRVRWYFDHDFLPLARCCQAMQPITKIQVDPMLLIYKPLEKKNVLCFQGNDTFDNKHPVLWNKKNRKLCTTLREEMKLIFHPGLIWKECQPGRP